MCFDDITSAYSHPFTAELSRHVDTVILQDNRNVIAGNSGFQSSVQSARLFLMEPGPIYWDIADLIAILKGRATCSTTSLVTSSDESNLGNTADACFRQLQGIAVDDGIGQWLAGIDELTVEGFSNIESSLLSLPLKDLPPLSTPGTPSILHVIWTLSNVAA